MTAANELSAQAARRAIAEGGLRVRDLVEACLARIDAREDTVQAWTWRDPARLRAAADALDARGESGRPLFGLPVGIKDIIDTADAPTGHGCAAYEANRPTIDAACVSLVRQADGLMAGKTVTTELAYFSPGKTRNPRAPAHTPGGSSSGSAAAVADAMVPLAYGTQTGGSVIRPASFCGIVGYKATHESLPTTGVKALARSLDTLGVFAREVDDVALMRAALIGAPPTPAPCDRPPTVGLCRTPEWEQADAASQQAVESAARTLAAAGARLQDVTLPERFVGLTNEQKIVMAFEAARDLAFEYECRRKDLQGPTIELIEQGLRTDHADYVAAIAAGRQARQALEQEFAEVDVLLCPSAVGEAPAIEAGTGDPLFNRSWTLVGNPCVNLPGHVGPNGLPVGVQAVGPYGDDDKLLAVCSWLAPRLA